MERVFALRPVLHLNDDEAEEYTVGHLRCGHGGDDPLLRQVLADKIPQHEASNKTEYLTTPGLSVRMKKIPVEP